MSPLPSMPFCLQRICKHWDPVSSAVAGKDTVGTLMYQEPVEMQAFWGLKWEGITCSSGELSVSDHEEEVGHQHMEEEKIARIVEDMEVRCIEQGMMLKTEQRSSSYLLSKWNDLLSEEIISFVKELHSLKTEHAEFLQRYDFQGAGRQLEMKLSALANLARTAQDLLPRSWRKSILALSQKSIPL